MDDRLCFVRREPRLPRGVEEEEEEEEVAVVVGRED